MGHYFLDILYYNESCWTLISDENDIVVENYESVQLGVGAAKG